MSMESYMEFNKNVLFLISKFILSTYPRNNFNIIQNCQNDLEIFKKNPFAVSY